jgi:hypothetical protein
MTDPQRIRIQNLFLTKDRVARFVAHLVTRDKEYNKYLEKQLKQMKQIPVVFEGENQWNVVITPHPNFRAYSCHDVRRRMIKSSSPSDFDCAPTTSYLTCTDKKCYCTQRIDPAYINIQPRIGDNYPAILRYMNGQISRLKKTWKEEESGYFVLLVRDFHSSATKKEIVQAFRSSDIHVVSLYDVFPELVPAAPVAAPAVAAPSASLTPVAPVAASASSSQSRVDLLEMRVARLEALLAKMGVQEE